MKQLFKADKIGAVSDAIKEKVGGFTVLEGNGRGSGKRQTMRAEEQVLLGSNTTR